MSALGEALQNRLVRLQFDPSDEADEQAFATVRDQLLAEFEPWANDRYGTDDASLVADAGTFLSWRFGYSTGDLTSFDRLDVEEFLLDWAPRKFAVGPEEAPTLCRSVEAMIEFLAVTDRLSGGLDRAARVMTHVDQLRDDVAAALGDRSKFGMGKSMMSIDLDGPDGNPLAGLGELLGSGEMDIEQLQGLLDERMAAFNALPHEERVAHTGPMFAAREPDPVELPITFVPPPIEQVEAGAADSELLRLVDAFAAYVAEQEGIKQTGTGNLKIATARDLVGILDTGDELDVGEFGRPRKTTSSADLRWLSLVVDVAGQAGAVARLKTRINPNPHWSDLPLLDRATAVVAGLLDVGPLYSRAGRFTDIQFELRGLLDDGIPHWLSRVIPEGSRLAFTDLVEFADLVAGELDPLVSMASAGLGLPGQIPVLLTESFEVLELAGLVEWHDRSERTGPYGIATWVESGDISLTPLGRHLMPQHVRDAGYTFPTLDDIDEAEALTVVNAVITASITEEQALARWRAETTTSERARLLTSAALDAGIPEQRLATFSLLGELQPVGDTAPAVRELLDSNCAGHAATFLLEHDLATPDEVGGFITLGPLVDMLSTVIGAPDELDYVFRQVQAGAIDDLLDDLWCHDQPETIEVLEALGRCLTDKRLAKAARKAALRHRSWLANQGR